MPRCPSCKSMQAIRLRKGEPELLPERCPRCLRGEVDWRPILDAGLISIRRCSRVEECDYVSDIEALEDFIAALDEWRGWECLSCGHRYDWSLCGMSLTPASEILDGPQARRVRQARTRRRVPGGGRRRSGSGGVPRNEGGPGQ